MPRKSKPGSKYPANWRAIATAIKESCGWACVRCGVPHSNQPGHTLGIHHADMDPSHSDPERWWFVLWPLCAPCHLQIQHKVNLDRPWVMAEHSPWARVYMGGWYAHKYLGLSLTRPEVEARLDELLGLERAAVLGRGGTA